ncbi:GntR family transcriptional regulator [Paraburkholderia edwinii]|uniref:GntR family transcriptional regulator n=1 Tax=Paraburkholderia edwinii TaxID=2861782 RepID=UPI001FE3FB67|nr:GntR family transcriptional regulator [Paraburkholderia edwinii]
MNTASLTSLQVRIARDIVALVRRDVRPVGYHLAETQLAREIGTSRSPVKAALEYLAELGVVTHDANRGFFLAGDSSSLTDVAEQFASSPDEPLYLSIASDRLAGKLPDEVGEAELMRRYNVARTTLRKVLSRIAREGWIEQGVGHGWRFLGMIDSPDAYDESFVFRQSIEVTGLLSPAFRYDPKHLEEIRAEQQRIVDGGWSTMTAAELFDANSHFHEAVARWSGNRFIYDSVRRINQLRRLVEYSQTTNRKPRKGQAEEHLAMLDAIARADLFGAAALMRSHLDGARRLKSPGAQAFSGGGARTPSRAEGAAGAGRAGRTSRTR